MKHLRMRSALWAALAGLAAALAVPTVGIGGNPPLPAKVGPGEGALNLVAWEGYAQPQWVKPFQQQTGCQVRAKYAGSSDEMVALLRQKGQFDLVSASGDASLRMIFGHLVQPVNVNLVPAWKEFNPAFQSPPNNTVSGIHYGVSLQWGPNILLYNTQKLRQAPASWTAIYDPRFKGQITIPDNPIQIADAALYLKHHRPGLGIRDPYELNDKQFNAAIDLLKQQKPLVKKYWALASDEIELFKNGDAVLGAAWPYQLSTLRASKAPVADTIPQEGATGWLDTWMLAVNAPHPNCAYRWMQYISTAKVQAMQAVSYGETPVNAHACGFMGRQACHQFHADAPLSYYKQIAFWKTPVADCGNGQQNCVPYTKWQQAWAQLKG